MSTHNYEALLRDSGLRVTPGRCALLQILEKEQTPVPVETLARKLTGALNTVTLYRALEAFEHAGIVMRSSLGHEHAHYELIPGRPHHHHVVCKSCGHIEDVEVSHSSTLENDALTRTKHFTSIEDYSLEFFGTCHSCVS